MFTNLERDELDSQVFSKIGEKLYLKPAKADVYFVFGSNDERIPAHKIILSSASDVFEAMFYGSLKEDDDIRIIDASAEVFIEFLRFFYFNKVKLNMENVSEIMYLAKKYDVQECLRVCGNMLAAKLTIDNVTPIYSLAVAYDETQLKEICEVKIRENAKEILQSPFLECDRHVLNHIVKVDFLPCSETEVFEACMSWVRAASKQENLTKDIIQTHLGDSFYEIRFGAMSLDEFLKLLPAYGHLFSGDEYNEILQMISGHEIQPKKFKGHRYSWDENKLIEWDRTETCLIEEKYVLQKLEATTFSSNVPLLLSCFECSPIFNCIDESRVRHLPIISSIVSDSRHVEAEFRDCQFNIHGCIVRLKKPLLIKPGIKYEIRFSFAENQYYASRELKSIFELESNIVLQFHNEPVQNGKTRGIVYGFGFNLLE